jgi:hypothetical protein
MHNETAEREAAQMADILGDKPYRSRAVLERLLDAKYDVDGVSTTPWLAIANDVISDYSLGIDASAYILQIAAARDAAAAQAAQAAADTRASLLSAAMVLVAAGGWWNAWADVGAAVLDAQAAQAADADWLRAEMATWDARERMMSIARRQPIIV